MKKFNLLLFNIKILEKISKYILIYTVQCDIIVTINFIIAFKIKHCLS